MLNTMSTHLARIEHNPEPSSSNTKGNLLKVIDKPIYKIMNVPQKDLECIKLGNETDDKIEEIRKNLEKLSIGKFTINTIEEEESLEVNKLRGNYYPKMRNYYSRPSPADVQFEERGDLRQNVFSGTEIAEWNVDGMSEQQILDLTCQMTMAATAYKTKGISDKNTAMAIIQGFTGQLKGWWDNSYNRVGTIW